MSFKTIECRLLICDGCGDGEDNGDFVTHYEASAQFSVDSASTDGWYLGEGVDYCNDCRATIAHEHIYEDGDEEPCAICCIVKDETEVPS